MRMRAGQAVVEALRAEGVTHVFGLIGTALMEVLDALYDAEDITFVGVRHEQNAVHMADGYARVSGRTGVAFGCQPGPGATNLVTGIAQARLAFSPVVALAGLPSRNHLDRGAFQEVDQQALFSPITKRTLTVHDSDRLGTYIRDAFRIAGTGQRGPVVVNIPSDVAASEVDATPERPATNRPQAGPAPTRSSIARAVELLADAERPLIIAGSGIAWSRASERLALLAEKLGAPVANSAGNSDAIANDHPLFAGGIGPRGNPVATRLARDADVILAIGTRLGFNTTYFDHQNISSTAAIIHNDIEPAAIGRYWPVALGIVADAGETVDALLGAVAQAPEREWVRTFRAERLDLLAQRDATFAVAADPLSPTAVCLAIQRALPRDAIVAVDTGTICQQATDVMQTFRTASMMTPMDFGLVGFAYAAGLGAKAAAPDRPVLTIMGDGGFGMAMGEIGTAVGAGLNTVTVVMNNGAWGAEKAYQRDFYAGRYLGANLISPPFDEIARSFHAEGVRAQSLDDVTVAVAKAFADNKPTVVEVPVDPDAIYGIRRDAFAHRSSAQ